jgi:hypothetical protein
VPVKLKIETENAYNDSVLPPGHMALKIRVEVPWVDTRRNDLVAMPTRQLSRYHNISLHTATPVSNKMRKITS